MMRSLNNLEYYLDLPYGALYGYTEGSAFQIEYQGNVGDTFSFNYAFFTEDDYFNDYSFVSLMMTYELADGNDTDYYGEYWGSFSYTVTAQDLYDGSFKFGIGIVDYGDYEGYSELETFDFTLDFADKTEDYDDDDDQTTDYSQTLEFDDEELSGVGNVVDYNNGDFA